MSASTTPVWESLRTDETRRVEDALRKTFEQADSYRYNSASIRVRVIDSKFAGKPREERENQVDKVLASLPESTQRDIVTVFCFAPEEIKQNPTTFREFMLNVEFDDPSPSML